MKQISEVIRRTQAQAEKIKSDRANKSVSRVNAAHAVLFEAFNVLIHYDLDEQMLTSAANILGKYMQDSEKFDLQPGCCDTIVQVARKFPLNC